MQAYLDAIPGWKCDIARQLDALIVKTVPGVRKAVRWNTPFYGVGDSGWFVAYHCFDRYLKVTFFAGQQLRPVPPVESKMPGVRYLHLYEGEPLDKPQLVAWLQQASALPGERLF